MTDDLVARAEKAQVWMRLPDYSDAMDLKKLVDWLNARPVSIITDLLARIEQDAATIARLVQACEAMREDYGAYYIDMATWKKVTDLADAAIAAAKED